MNKFHHFLIAKRLAKPYPELNADLVSMTALAIDLFSESHRLFSLVQPTTRYNFSCLIDAIQLNEYSKDTWCCFHFWPGNEGTGLEKFVVVKDPQSLYEVAKASVLRVKNIENKFLNEASKKRLYGFIFGIYSHVLADTFTHNHFSGVESKLNKATLTGTFRRENKDKVKKVKDWHKKHKMKPPSAFTKWAYSIAGKSVDWLGHAAVGSLIDVPGQVEFVIQGKKVRKIFFKSYLDCLRASSKRFKDLASCISQEPSYEDTLTMRPADHLLDYKQYTEVAKRIKEIEFKDEVMGKIREDSLFYRAVNIWRNHYNSILANKLPWHLIKGDQTYHD